jgi:hypothetical protein
VNQRVSCDLEPARESPSQTDFPSRRDALLGRGGFLFGGTPNSTIVPVLPWHLVPEGFPRCPRTLRYELLLVKKKSGP